MYVQNNSSFLYSAQEDKNNLAQVKEKKPQNTLEVYLKNFSEKAQVSFESLSSTLPKETKTELIKTLNNIGKAAAFSSMNGFDSQDERLLVNQYFNNFEGVISDDMIKRMIFSKLDNSDLEHAKFLREFASSLDEPLKSIDITV
jgi:hypothetical protein